MRRFLSLPAGLGAAVIIAVSLASSLSAAEGRQTLSFDQGWRFHLGDVAGAEKPETPDAAWRQLDVPHDFSIEGPPGADPATMEGPFDRKCPGGTGCGALNGGIGWYRKTFTLPEDAKGKRVVVHFDGVYMDSDVWLNGVHLGKQPYGYTSFRFDLTAQLKPGANVLAVRVNVQQPCSRWYSGAGIYRHVRLTITDPVHVAPWGTYITTPKVADAAAEVRVRTRVQNESSTDAEVVLVTSISDIDRPFKEYSSRHKIAAGQTHEFDQTHELPRPRLWSTEDPYLYQLASRVYVNGKPVDQCETPFGIRTIEFTADKGFLLNGRHVPIRGVCNHHDLGCLGAAVHARAIQRQLEILRAMGCNAIRTSHNPPAPELLDLCDRMGFVVMDEAFDEWLIPKSGMGRFGYKRFFDEWSERDLVAMIHRDRNHPCVVLWSIGNEIKEQAAPQGGAMARRLAEICHREDPTRPVTSGCNKIGPASGNGFLKALDVIGINYFVGNYHSQKGRPLVAAETASALSTRGHYGLVLQGDGKVGINGRMNNQCVSYDTDCPGWGCTAEDSLLAVKGAPWLAGEFVWTGFDYLGEPTPYRWPSRSSYFGIIDLAGFPKDRYYLYQSQWTDKPVLHLLPHWNWKGFEGKEIPVWCFTNAESVELYLNGRSLGVKDFKDTKRLHLEWKVPYEPGVLRAEGRKGNRMMTAQVNTAGEPAKLMVRPDRRQIAADGEDLSFVEIGVVDKAGNLCPDADNLINFTLEGPATIAGVDNGDPTSHEPFKASRRKAFHGLCLAVVKAGRTPGEVRLSATSPGLQAEPVVVIIGPAGRQ